MNNEIRIPNIEVIVGAAGNDVAVICFYQREDIHDGYDVVAAVGSQNEINAVVQILQDAITALHTKDWYDVDELRSQLDPDVEEPPF